MKDKKMWRKWIGSVEVKRGSDPGDADEPSQERTSRFCQIHGFFIHLVFRVHCSQTKSTFKTNKQQRLTDNSVGHSQPRHQSVLLFSFFSFWVNFLLWQLHLEPVTWTNLHDKMFNYWVGSLWLNKIIWEVVNSRAIFSKCISCN